LRILLYPYQQAEHVLTIYREVKQRIFRENRQAKIIFLECPFLSVYRWNKHRGREYNTQTEEIEKKIFTRFICQFTSSKPDVYNKTLGSSGSLNEIFNEIGADVCTTFIYKTEEIEKKQDTELKSITKYFNDQLQLINRDWTTPKISQDQIILSKKKRISHANYKVNYNLLMFCLLIWIGRCMYIFTRFICQFTSSKPDVYNKTLGSSGSLNEIFNEIGADV
jgi:hypothetical protein